MLTVLEPFLPNVWTLFTYQDCQPGLSKIHIRRAGWIRPAILELELDTEEYERISSLAIVAMAVAIRVRISVDSITVHEEANLKEALNYIFSSFLNQ